MIYLFTLFYSNSYKTNSVCYKDLLVLMTSLSLWRRHNLKILYFKNTAKNISNKQKILLLSLTKQFLGKGWQSCPSLGTNRTKKLPGT